MWTIIAVLGIAFVVWSAVVLVRTDDPTIDNREELLGIGAFSFLAVALLLNRFTADSFTTDVIRYASLAAAMVCLGLKLRRRRRLKGS